MPTTIPPSSPWSSKSKPLEQVSSNSNNSGDLIRALFFDTISLMVINHSMSLIGRCISISFKKSLTTIFLQSFCLSAIFEMQIEINKTIYSQNIRNLTHISKPEFLALCATSLIAPPFLCTIHKKFHPKSRLYILNAISTSIINTCSLSVINHEYW